MNKTDRFRSDMVTENIELKKEIGRLRINESTLEKITVRQEKENAELKAELGNAKIENGKFVTDNIKLEERWEMLKEFIQPVGWRTPYMDNMTLVEVLMKMKELESGGKKTEEGKG